MLKIAYISAVLLLLVGPIAFGQTVFAPEQLQEDLRFYRSKLERYHPNLYLYTPKERIDAFFDSLSQSIRQPLSEAAFYQGLTLSSSLVKDGHTLILPSDDFMAYHNANSRFLPLQIGLTNDHLYVKKSFTRVKMIGEGSVIERINGLSADQIIREMRNRQVRDGHNLSYANWILDAYFREYYSFIFGHPERFEISFTNPDHSKTERVQIQALAKDSIAFYRTHNYPAPDAAGKPEKGIYLSYDPTRKTAILTIKDFHSSVLRHAYKQRFNKEIRAVFKEIASNSTQNLVLDLRDNQGGDVENGVFLLSFLINRPFKVVNEYRRKINNKLVVCNGPSRGYHQPRRRQFKGKIYVLVNGGSFSNSAIVSSCLKEYTNAVFVGTETGGNPHVLAGMAKSFELPNTKIRVDIPKKRFVMTALIRNTGRGLIPVRGTTDGLQEKAPGKDKEIELVLALINRK